MPGSVELLVQRAGFESLKEEFAKQPGNAVHGVTKAYVVTSHTGRVDYDQQAAAQGFQRLGVAVEYVTWQNLPTLSASELLVDGVDQVRRVLTKAGRKQYAWNDYPPELAAFYGRKLETVTWGELNARGGEYFVKKAGKGNFQPAVMRFPWKPTGDDDSDYNACHVEDDDVLLASEPVEFIGEWRAFCVDGDVLDVRQYNGDWRNCREIDLFRVVAAASLFRPKVRGYSIDFGLTDKGETLVVETNAGHSLGSYGLRPDLYATLLAAAWAGVWGDE